MALTWPRTCRRLAVLSVIGLVLLADRSQAGRGHWSPPQDWHSIAVQMALVPGDDNPYRARVVWWVDEDTALNFYGGQWGWRADSDNVDCSTYPAVKFDSLGLPSPPNNAFCSGLVHLQDGRLLTIGGTELGTEYGTKAAQVFAPGSNSGAGSWSTVAPMFGARWYPTATVLNDGSIMTSSGSLYPHIEMYGGIEGSNTFPANDTLYRFGVDTATVWDAAIPQSSSPSNWPPALYGHSAVTVPYFGTTIYFGGRDTTGGGTLTNLLRFEYRNPNPHGSDYIYNWVSPNPLNSINPRAFHSTIVCDDSTMIVWGGLLLFGGEHATHELWRLRRVTDPLHPSSIRWKWEQLTEAGTLRPGSRLRHRAVYDSKRHRLVMFGGAPDTSSTPNDFAVWALTLPTAVAAGDTATWQRLGVIDSTVHPDARMDHSMELADEAVRTIRGVTYPKDLSAIAFGGRAGGTKYNDLWRLVFVGSDSVRWSQFTAADSVPVRRYAHSLTIDPSTFELYAFGGKDAADAAVGDTIWRAQLDDTVATWRAFPGRPDAPAMAWHSAVMGSSIYNRLAEVYSPGTNSWSHSSGDGSYLLQSWFPQNFLTPGGMVFSAGPGDTSYLFNPATKKWRQFPLGSGAGYTSDTLIGGTAVMYRPGKVMKCGSASTISWGSPAPRAAMKISTSSPDTLWSHSAGMFYGRDNMNLTLLPTGQVLVTGGMGIAGNFANSQPVRRPEIWDPNANGGVGTWSGGDSTQADTLSMSQVPRGYHSTALLLPDARVLCAGGNGENIGTDYNKADIFCPPYLFTDQTCTALATRPEHVRPPARRLGWNKVFTVATRRAATINRVCLIKAGATTHALNMDQRYDSLSFVPYTADTAHKRLFVTTPSDSNVAPPGDYMLFMVDSTSATAATVPSIATWLSLGDAAERDSADVTAPATIDSITLDVSNTSVILEFTAPADDDTLAASGMKVATYDVRHKSTAMTDSASWAGGTPTSPSSTIQAVGNLQTEVVGGLSSCVTYHFGVRAMDDNRNLGGISPDVSAQTLCGGGGGGGSARPAAGAFGAIAATTQQSGAVVVVRTTRSPSGEWRIDAKTVGNTVGLGLSDTTGMFIQMPDGTGGYGPAIRVPLSVADNIVGLGALRDGRRVVLANGYALQSIASTFKCGGRTLGLTSAAQGSIGTLDSTFLANGGSVSVAVGDSLTLTYGPKDVVADSGACWFATIAQVGVAQAGSRRGLSGAIPARFALHQNAPNPFSAKTMIRFDLPIASNVRLDLFDAQGRRVKTLADRLFPAGYQSVTWDPTQAEGHRVTPGVYFYRIQAGSFQERKKLVLIGN